MQVFFSRFEVTLLNEHLGNDKSILRSIEIAAESDPEEWVYLCEDDYLHVPHAFQYISEFIEHRRDHLRMRKPIRVRKGSERFWDAALVIHPADYPDRYRRHERKFSLIFTSKYCHWRQISNTTFTILSEGKTFAQFRKLFDRSAIGASDGYLSKKLYGARFFGRKALCVSPIPGLATHMHEDTMTPLVDWGSVAEAYKKELGEYVVTGGSEAAYSEQSLRERA
jgi:hypothetical protein